MQMKWIVAGEWRAASIDRASMSPGPDYQTGTQVRSSRRLYNHACWISSSCHSLYLLGVHLLVLLYGISASVKWYQSARLVLTDVLDDTVTRE